MFRKFSFSDAKVQKERKKVEIFSERFKGLAYLCGTLSLRTV